MKNFTLTIILSIVSIMILNACGSIEPRRGYRTDHNVVRHARNTENYGTVSDIDVISVESRTSGGGAVLGAVIGGVIGHQVGSGRGNDVATGLGAVGGALAGNNVERRNGRDSEIYRISVRLDNGARQTFDYADINGLRVGDRVKVERGQLLLL